MFDADACARTRNEVDDLLVKYCLTHMEVDHPWPTFIISL